MNRNQAIKLLADAGRDAQAAKGLSAAEKTALQVLHWTPINRDREGHDFAAGFVTGVHRMAPSDLDQRIASALFMMSEIMRFDGPIPETQVAECARDLRAMAPAKIAA